MSAYEQRVEPPDKKWQYLLFAAEPYETIAFKVSQYFMFIGPNICDPERHFSCVAASLTLGSHPVPLVFLSFQYWLV